MLTISAIRTMPQYKINFQSNKEREAESRRLRQLIRERERRAQEALERARQIALARALAEEEARRAEEARKVEEARQAELQKNRERIFQEIVGEMNKYPDVDDEMSIKMAGFLAQFTCAIQNNSEHDIREFFGDEETAKELREKLSPECQHDSLELRNELQKIDETKDPVMMLIAANNMKRFMPKQGILNAEQQENLIQGIKDTITMAIQNGDMSKFDDEEKNAIGVMVQMIKASVSTDFGISVKLKALIDKLNKKKLNLGFIPPVQVKELVTNAIKESKSLIK